MSLTRRIAVARGDQPADLLLKNARIINTFTGEIEEGSVAICEETIAGIGDYQQAKEIIYLKGSYLAPGLIKTRLSQALWDNPQRQEQAEAAGPAGRIGEVKDVSGAALLLASDAGSYINGQYIIMDGGSMARN